MKRRHRLLVVLLMALCLSFVPVARAEPAPVVRGLPALNVAALAASPTHLYVGGFDAGLYVVDRSGTARRFEHHALSPHINTLAWSAAERALWLGTARGLVRCDMKPAATCRRLGPSGAVHALLLRRDGSLWAGGDAGLALVTAGTTRVLGKKDGSPFRSVWALAESPDGTLFVGATNGLFWSSARDGVRSAQKWQRAALVTGQLPDDWVTALLHHDGKLHVGTYNGGAVSFAHDGEALVSLTEERAAGYVNPAGITHLHGAEVALATMDGLRIGLPGQTRRRATQAKDITAVLLAWEGGGYWLGTRQGLEWIDLSGAQQGP